MKTEDHVCQLLVELAVNRGAKDIDKCEGLFEMKIDDVWEAKCNGHAETIDNVPSYHWSIYYNGWPAGILHVMGDGVLCNGSEGNEENLRKALKAQLELSVR